MKPVPTDPSIDNSKLIDAIFNLFHERGDRLYGEAVTERSHAVQCASLAQAEGCSATLVAAALLHDIGHLLHDMGEDIAQRGVDARHEDQGASWLRTYFPDEVTEPVRLHVAAKRYLAAVDSRYLAALSPASAQSLALQGGPMTPAECARFEASPHARQAVRLRQFDDAGKDTNLPAIAPERFREILEAVVLPQDHRRA